MDREYWENAVVDLARFRVDLAAELSRTGDSKRFSDLTEVCQLAALLERRVSSLFLSEEVERV